METVLEFSGTDVAFSELLATQPESLPSQAGDTAEMAPKIDFSATGVVAATPGVVPDEAHVVTLAPQVLPDPAQPANMPQG